jgi:hypothetical protein
VFVKRQRILTERHKRAYSKVGALNAVIMTSPLPNSPNAMLVTANLLPVVVGTKTTPTFGHTEQIAPLRSVL